MQAPDIDDARARSTGSGSSQPLSSSGDPNFETATTDVTDDTVAPASNFTEASAYTSLLGQVGNLHGDLSKTVALCHKLREENASLKDGYDRLRAQHLELHDKYIIARKQAVEESTTRINLEQRHDELVQKWRKQLEKKADEFRSLKANLRPAQDLEVLRGQLRQELELKHKSSAEALEKQVDNYRKMYYEEKRAHQILKTELQQFKQNRKSESEATRKHHEGFVAGLKDRVSELETEIDNITVQESERKVQLKLEEKKAEVEALEVEMQSLRTENTRRVNSLQAENLELQREVIESKQHLREASTQAAGLRSRLALVEKAKTDLEGQRDRLKSKVSSAESHIERLEQQASQAEKQAKKERLACAESIAEAREEANSLKHKLNSQIDSLQRSLSQKECEYVSKIGEVSAELKSSISLGEQEKRQLEQALSTLSGEAKERESALQTSLQHTQNLLREERELRNQAQTQCDTLSREIAQLEQTRTILQQKIHQLEDDVGTSEERKQAAESKLVELEREYSNLRDKHRESVVKTRELKSSQDFADTSIAHLEEEVQQLRKSETTLRANLAAVEERRVELLESTQEKENILKTSLKAELQKGQASVQTFAQKFKKKQTGYRAALTKCKRRIGELKKRASQLEQELATQAQLHQVESESSHRRIRELERERDLVARRQLSSVYYKSTGAEQAYPGGTTESTIEGLSKHVDELLENS